MKQLNEAVAEWRHKQEKHVVQTKQYGKTAKEIDKLLTRIRELEAEVQEANDNATWWRNRYTAMEKRVCSRSDCAGRIKDSKKIDSVQQRLEKATNIIEDTLTIMKESRCNKLWYYDKDNMKHEWDFEHLIPKIEEFLEILKGESNE